MWGEDGLLTLVLVVCFALWVDFDEFDQIQWSADTTSTLPVASSLHRSTDQRWLG